MDPDEPEDPEPFELAPFDLGLLLAGVVEDPESPAVPEPDVLAPDDSVEEPPAPPDSLVELAPTDAGRRLSVL